MPRKKTNTKKPKTTKKSTPKKPTPKKKPVPKKKAPVAKKKATTATKKSTPKKTATTKAKVKTSTKKQPKTEKKATKKETIKKVEDNEDFQFVNYFKSEPQLDTITHNSPPEDIIKAYERIIWVTAKKHLRQGTDLEDLLSQGKLGVCEAIIRYQNPEKRPKYKFHMLCLYNIRNSIFKYCIGNVNQLKTPVYIQRELMHVAQIFQLMNNQSVAEKILGRPGPSTENEVITFLYDEDERLPLKSKTFIKKQINKKVSSTEFDQIYGGIVTHELGSRHSYVKNNLTDIGKILHIKEKIWYTFKSNNMKYERGMKLILSARVSQDTLDAAVHTPIPGEKIEQKVARRQLLKHGEKVCGEENFKILLENKCLDMNYDEIATKYKLRKSTVTEIIKKSIKILQKDPIFKEYFEELF